MVLQGLSADVEAGANDAALEDAVLIDEVDRHRGAEIRHNDGISHNLKRGRGRHHAVRANLLGIVEPDLDRQRDVLADDVDLLTEVFLGDPPDEVGPRGLNAADDDNTVAFLLLRGIENGNLPPRVDQTSSQLRLGRSRDRTNGILRTVEKEPDADVRISDVYSNDVHYSYFYCTSAVLSTPMPQFHHLTSLLPMCRSFGIPRQTNQTQKHSKRSRAVTTSDRGAYELFTAAACSRF